MDDTEKKEKAQEFIKLFEDALIIKMDAEDYAQVGIVLENMLNIFFQSCEDKAKACKDDEERHFFEKCMVNFLFIATKIVCNAFPVDQLDFIKDSIFKELISAKKETVE